MKKIFSSLLVMCMVFSLLTIGVSASYTAPTTEKNYNTFTFDGTISMGYNVGDFYLSNGTDLVKLGTITDDVTKMGKKFKQFVFENGSLTGAKESTLSIRAEVHDKESKYNFTYSQGHCGTEYFTVSQMDKILAATEENTSKVVKYTMYAYSARNDGEDINFNLVTQQSDFGKTTLTVPASKLYSKNHTPHKIDFIVYQTSASSNPITTANNDLCVEIWIDGLYYKGDSISNARYTDSIRFMFLSANVNFTPDASGNVSWKDSELYVWSYTKWTTGKPYNLTDTTNGGEYLTVHTRDALHSQFFQNVDYLSENEGAKRSDFVTGVNSELKNDIESIYTTKLESGDRVLKVEEAFYNNPASIWTGDTSNVTLVKKSNGTVYNAGAAVTGTFDDYYIAINGVYTNVEKETVSYNVAEKTVGVDVTSLPEGAESMQIIVAAYNEFNKVEKLKVSPLYTDFTSKVTYVIEDESFPVNAHKYKVFIFDNLMSAVPLVEVTEVLTQHSK